MKNDLSTTAVHGGEPHPRIEGAVTLPVFQSSTYEFEDNTSYYDIKYSRLNNSPNHLAVNQKIALLESAEAGLVLGSGMAAISSTALGLLSKGDHIVAQTTLYGASQALFQHHLPRFGITCDFAEPSQFAKLIRPETKIIYVESISNPLMEVPDFAAVTALAKKHGLLAVIDNTFASPVNFRPLKHGFDLSLHSATKYLNGHSDVVAGAVAGSKVLIDKINKMAAYLGGTLDPHACSLLQRGMKTLTVRVDRQNKTAFQLAAHLQQHPKVKSVFYPGLESHRSFANAAKYLSGFGGMMSFELRDAAATNRFMKALKIPILAPSLGGVESLVIQPALSSHGSLTAQERSERGISDALIRLSVGLENLDDLIKDLDQAFNTI
jgi:cystathionine beta-lyase/cystathionine gamma-synthase